MAPNVVSGAIVGIVALPLVMAFAIASGAKSEQGLYTAIMAGVTLQHGIDGLQIATLMASGILLLLGVTRMGAVIKYIPAPVIVGFTAGIGIIIWVDQWRDFLGLPGVSADHFHQKLWLQLQSFAQLHVPTMLLALLSLVLLIYVPKIKGLKRVPGPLIALVFAASVQSLFDFNGVATIGSAFGGIPQGLLTLQLPHVTLTRVLELIGPSFAITMLGAIESLLSAVVADVFRAVIAANHQRFPPPLDDLI